MTAPAVTQISLLRLRHERRWSRGEKRAMLVLLSNAPYMSEQCIEQVARVRHSTLTILLDTLAAYDLAAHNDLGHYRLTDMGRAFCLEIMGLV